MTEIFVFGSNLAGRHGKGAAAYARQHHGAILGQGEGLQGNSYGIATKTEILNVRPLAHIRESVKVFIQFAKDHPEMQFNLTPIGCGHAGYRPIQIGPLFEGCPPNVNLPDEFKPYV